MVFVIRQLDPSNTAETVGMMNLLSDPITSQSKNGDEAIFWLAEDIQMGRKVIFIAVAYDEVIGTATISFTRTFNDEGRLKGFLNDMQTSPAHRRNGVGTALIQRCLDEASLRGASHVTLACSDKNKAFYENRGFTHKYYHMVAALPLEDKIG